MEKDFTNRTRASNKRIIEDIENWLEHKQGCPFGCFTCSSLNSSPCSQVFLKLAKRADCPCHEYSLSHIVRVAKQAIKELS